MRELEAAVAILERIASPEGLAHERLALKPEAESVLPRATTQRRPPSQEPPLVLEEEEPAIVTELDRPATQRPPRRAPPLAPTADRPRRLPRGHTARDVALGIGGAGLALSALTLGANIEEGNTAGYVVSGIGLGIGLIGIGTAGIITLAEDEEQAQRPRVRARADGFVFEF